MSLSPRLAALLVLLAGAFAAHAADPPPTPWLLGHAYKIPSQYTNQESGYFSIIEGKNGRLYIGAAKYGVDAYLLEFDPKAEAFRMVLDVQKEIGTDAKGFAAQAKIHTRNNVGASGKVYVGSKQGYPDKTEKRDDYPGGYVFAYDPATGKAENFGMAQAHFGIISVMPDEARGVAYVSTCSDDRPLDRTHFMILDLAKHSYRDLGDMGRLYPFIVLDDKGRAYHPAQGGKVARYDPTADKLDKLTATVDDKPLPESLARDEAILNWDAAPDRKTLFCVEMTTNALFSFDLTASDAVPGKRLGELLPGAKMSDCRAMCVGPSGRVWAAVTEQGTPDGAVLHLVGYKPGDKAARDFGPVGVANADFTKFTDADGKPLPWHHTMRKAKDGTLAPWQPMGVCEAADGTVYVTTIAPFTLLRFTAEMVK